MSIRSWRQTHKDTTAREVIQLARCILELCGEIDTTAPNPVIRGRLFAKPGKLMLSAFTDGRLEIRRTRDTFDAGNIICYGLVCSARGNNPDLYDSDAIDGMLVELRGILVLEELTRI